jgi:hypothetical protein
MEPIFDGFFKWCEEANVTVVVAAGNIPGGRPLHEGMPQKFGTDENSIITVGGIRQDGTLWPGTAPHKPDTKGSMTIYAPAEKIEVPGLGGERLTNPKETSGTSQAAAIVVRCEISLSKACVDLHQSGLMAYLYSLPNITDISLDGGEGGLSANKMKRLLTAHAWTRINKQGLKLHPPSWTEPEELLVPYNFARGDPIHSGGNSTSTVVSS